MDEIKGIARVKFHPGKVEEWKRLTEEEWSAATGCFHLHFWQRNKPAINRPLDRTK